MHTEITKATTTNTAMLLVTAIAGFVLIAPFLWTRLPWFVVWAIVLVIPHVLIAVRVHRSPLDPAGPALALGLSAVMIVAGAMLIAVQWGRAEWLPLLYAVAFVTTYIAMAKSAVTLYKSSTRSKPHWRLLGRGLVDTLVYYAVVCVIAAGMGMHLD